MYGLFLLWLCGERDTFSGKTTLNPLSCPALLLTYSMAAGKSLFLNAITTVIMKYAVCVGRLFLNISILSFYFRRVIISLSDCFIWKDTLSVHPYCHPNIMFAYLFASHSIILSKTGRLILCFENKRYRMR